MKVVFFSSLPASIDPAVAIDALRSQRDKLQNLLQHCLLGVSQSLYSRSIIPNQVLDTVRNHHLKLNSTERCAYLLDCVESRIEVLPSDFTEVIRILVEDPFLQQLAEDLVQSYCE